MDILQVQDRLKNFSQDQLVSEMQAPSGNAPQFLVLSEIMRRKRMQDDFATQQGNAGSESTVAQEAIASAGVPQGGIADMARAMAPSTDMTQNTGVQAMASGGTVKKMQVGGAVMTDPAIISMANRSGMSVEEFLGSLSPEEAANLQNYAARTATRGRMTGMEPVGNPPAQGPEVGQFEPVNPSYVERGSVFPNDTVRPPTGPAVDYQPLYNTREQLPINITPADQLPERPAARPGALADVAPYTLPDFTRPVPEYQEDFGTASSLPPSVQTPAQGGNPMTEFQEDFGGPPAEGPVPGVMERIFGAPALERIGVETSRTPTPVPIPDDRQQAIEERAAGLEGIAATAAKTAEEAKAAKAAAEEAILQGGGGAGGGGGGAGIAGAASGMTSYEQELMDALARREQAATQDKWLALAQVGLNLMSSDQPTFGGALGEAGLAGVQAAQGARDQYEKDRLDLTGALEQSRMSRAQAAAAAARGAAGAKPKALPEGALDVYDADIEAIDTALNDTLNPPTPEQELLLKDQRARLAGERASLRNVYLSQYGLAPAGASPATTSTVGLADLADE